MTEDIDKIIVDSRYHYNDIQRFVSHFMPSLKQKVELYHGDIPIFDAYNISTELSRALERKVWLKSGGYLVIDQAEALVAIDVNTGRYVGKKNLEDTILKTNLEAVQEIAYQLRLRNCGGIIILDLIDMEKEENKQRVYRALEEALKRDRARPTIIKISELGLVEMTRKRTRDTIVRALCESCSHCEGKGFIKSKATVAYEVLREIEREVIERDVSKMLVQAHPDVIDILAIDERETLDQIERRYRKQIYLQAVTDYHPEQFEVNGDSHGRKPAAEQFDRARARDRDRRRGRGGRGRDRDRGRGGGGGDRDRGGGGGDREQHAGGSEHGRDRNRDRGRDRNRDREGGDRNRHQQHRPHQLPQPLAVGDAASPDVTGANYVGPPAGITEDMSEEDRLAFLRAQAAQDAALATGAPGAGQQQQNGRGSHGGPGAVGGGGRDRDRDRGGRRRRGRRGGKFRRDERGPAVGAKPNPGPAGAGANAGASDAPASSEAPRESGSSGSGGGGGEEPPRTPTQPPV